MTLWSTLISPPLFLSCSISILLFSTTNSRNNYPPVSTQLNLPQQIWPPQHSVYQYLFFWFKFYWEFFTLSKQIYPFFYLNTILKCYFFLYIFVIYVFCLGVYLFYSFFKYKFVKWIYDFYQQNRNSNALTINALFY